ncbi:ATP-binding protein [Candidatus Neomarinimicrobiota bacterium]
MYQRPMLQVLRNRLAEPRRFIQVLSGPRQAGKTTIARQLMEALDIPHQYGSADAPTLQDAVWIGEQWEAARLLASASGDGSGKAVLILDEIQKVPGWPDAVKLYWDEDTAADRQVYVIILGSSPWLIQRGLTESLAGRFELIQVSHWSYGEMQAAFGWSVEQFIFYGGYPGAAEIIDDSHRWRSYIVDALIETTIARDVLLMTQINKPALLRRLFELGCRYSGQILSYQKMLGQLHDAGNTTTLAHYLELLDGAGLLTGLQKYSGSVIRQRGSSPKLQVRNTALITAQSGRTLEEARQDREGWGRLVESAVGAHLINGLAGGPSAVHYWRDGNREVDFVLSRGDRVAGIEVASGAPKRALPGMARFVQHYPTARTVLAGSGGMPLEEFFSLEPSGLVE